MTATAVVAGGGLAGGAVACLLARAGKKVLLLEREAAPGPKICGEFLSVEAMGYLRQLGLDPPALGGSRITAMRLIRGRRAIEAALPFEACGLSRETLDTALLRAAAAAGAEIRFGQTLSGVTNGAPMTLSVNGQPISADTLFLATGKHDARGLRRAPKAAPEDLVGFKTHWRLAPTQARALENHVELLAMTDGYAGLQPIDRGRANLCLLVSGDRLRRAGGTWDTLLDDLCRNEPHMATRLTGAVPLSDRPCTIARVPYGHVHRGASVDLPRVYRLGDQFAVIPSFVGDGMAIALHSAAVAVAAYLAGETAAAFHARLHADVGGQVGRAMALYRFGRWPPGQALLMRLMGLLPSAVARLGAAATRVPSGCLIPI